MDSACNVWLLEINCSPTFEHSTPITSALVRALSADIVRVTVDVPRTRATGASRRYSAAAPADGAAAAAPPLIGRSGGNAAYEYVRSFDGTDTGGFECIFRDLPRPPGGGGGSIGMAVDNLSLTGKPLKLPPKPAPVRPTFPSRRGSVLPTAGAGAAVPPAAALAGSVLPDAAVTTVGVSALSAAAAESSASGGADRDDRKGGTHSQGATVGDETAVPSELDARRGEDEGVARLGMEHTTADMAGASAAEVVVGPVAQQSVAATGAASDDSGGNAAHRASTPRAGGVRGLLQSLDSVVATGAKSQ